MTKQILWVAIAQLMKVANRVKTINFIDANLNTLRDELVACAIQISLRDVAKMTSAQMRDCKSDVDLSVGWLLSLEDTVRQNLPAQMKYIVIELMKEWKVLDNRIALFATGDFSVCQFHKVDFMVQSNFEKRCSTRLSKIPVVFKTPVLLKDDMLFTISLFHEVGHVVELVNNISQYVYESYNTKYGTKTDTAVIRNYFNPMYGQKTFDVSKFKAYVKEYISDLFSVQYANIHALSYLGYLECIDVNKASDTHPSYSSREKLASSFISYLKTNSTTDLLLQWIVDCFKNLKIGLLKSRVINFDKDSIVNGVALEITRNSELFSLCHHSWDATCLGNNDIEAMQGIVHGTLDRLAYYDIVNSTVKDTVDKYIARI